ncbi:hypothetical protein [Candidatus Similichlamydia epinepheli]|uniref:hypothetical protein n=1 Tax=Candidatus Similichlamydia epinepheli TaxID=1903953 RepID=UPI000D3BF861|nr:hypothetical protein [Candidatus Similichlamydia epinepheli]
MYKKKCRSERTPGEICLEETDKTLSVWKSLREAMTQMKEKSEDISRKYGMSLEEFASYVNNPSNFSHEDWQRIEDNRKKVFLCFREIGMVREQMKLCMSPISKKKEKKVRRLWGIREGWIQS